MVLSNTTTLATRAFEINARTGFMPPTPPPARLPEQWELWESLLFDGIDGKLEMGDSPDISEAAMARSEAWRSRARALPILSVEEFMDSDILLRRAHHVLAWLLHIYVHSLPPHEPARIPPPITVPLLTVSQRLDLPPVLTYGDCVLYNWTFKNPAHSFPTVDNIRCRTLVTGTNDEQEFNLASARIELQGAAALRLMCDIMDEALVGGTTAIRHMTADLHTMTAIIKGMKGTLLAIRENCDPDVFYNHVRPWLRGQDLNPDKQWVFEGMDEHPELRQPIELSGPSAGQSSLIQALDVFLGVDKHTHSSSAASTKAAFLSRMQLYMPRPHRAFLAHLGSHPRPLRELVSSAGDTALLDAYNEAVFALKEFRDAHMIIATIFIAAPARRARKACGEASDGTTVVVKGTGGTDMLRFLKSVRDQTTASVISTA